VSRNVLPVAAVWLLFCPWLADVTVDCVSGAAEPLRESLDRATREQPGKPRNFVEGMRTLNAVALHKNRCTRVRLLGLSRRNPQRIIVHPPVSNP
jgi:hypothetical protein